MPEGGPDASWLDRWFYTNWLEYLDRYDVDDLKRKTVRLLDRGGRRRLIGTYRRFARMAFDRVADMPTPKFFEFGCGLGGLFGLRVCRAVRRTS